MGVGACAMKFGKLAWIVALSVVTGASPAWAGAPAAIDHGDTAWILAAT